MTEGRTPPAMLDKMTFLIRENAHLRDANETLWRLISKQHARIENRDNRITELEKALAELSPDHRDQGLAARALAVSRETQR
jgi:hypothetical protein